MAASQEQEQDPFPDVVRIESVGICNFRCTHCPTGLEPNNRLVLEEDRFEALLAQLMEGGSVPRVVVLYHGGEPLINKRLADYVRRLKALGVAKTVITTNASLLTAERSRELIEAGLDEMKVSFDGESPEENDRIRRKGNFARDAGNLKELLRIRRELGVSNPTVRVSNVRLCSRETLEELQRSGLRLLPQPADYLKAFFAEELEELEFQGVPAMVWPGLDDTSDYDVVELPPEEPSYCSALFETVTVLSNGDVVPCCYDLRGDLVLGNAREEDLRAIWDGAHAKVRDEFRRGDYPALCQNCEVVRPRFLTRRLTP